MPKPPLKNSGGAIDPLAGRDKKVHIFSKGINLKVNIIT